MNKETLLNHLRSEIITVSFTKRDGTERTMKCTLQESYLPKLTNNVLTEKRDEPDDYVTVWDVEKDGWRRFRLDSINSITPEK